MIIRQYQKDRVKRYRKAYPDDNRADIEIIKELDRIRKEKKHIDDWINRQVYEDNQDQKTDLHNTEY